MKATVRRIVKVGGSHLVTIPAEFIGRHNLKAGDEVAVIITNESITIFKGESYYGLKVSTK